MEKCPECKKEAVVERSSYKLCHACNTVFKTDWRKKIEDELGRMLKAEFLAGYKVGNEAVVQWVSKHAMGKEYGVHTAIFKEGSVRLVYGYYVQDNNEGAVRSSENYMDRKERLQRTS